MLKLDRYRLYTYHKTIDSGKVTVELKDGNNIIPTNVLLDATVNWMSNITTSDTTSVASSAGAVISTDSEHEFQVGDKVKYLKGGTALFLDWQ